jgi:glycosyltransferase involved in cell wall biosynthesis
MGEAMGMSSRASRDVALAIDRRPESTDAAAMAPELSLVIPVFNEAATIEETVRRWAAVCVALRLVTEIIVVDDGSTDGTGERVQALAMREVPFVRVLRQPNGGHGAALRCGYAATRGAWVMQIDADDEVGPEPFAALWSARRDVDMVLGARQGREQVPIRRHLTRGARLVTRLLCSRALEDVNAPYRLMSRRVLSSLLPLVSAHSETPNLAITWLAARQQFRLRQVPVRVVRTDPRQRLRGWPLLRMACRGIADAWRVRRAGRTNQ